MFVPARPTRSAAWLLAAALLHYPFACPCGCLEHHALLQAFATEVGSDSSHRHNHEPTRDTHGPSVADHHCDDDATSLYVSTRSRGLPLHSHCVLVSQASARVPSVPAITAPTGEVLGIIAVSNRALGVCAELQVMLI